MYGIVRDRMFVLFVLSYGVVVELFVVGMGLSCVV